MSLETPADPPVAESDPFRNLVGIMARLRGDPGCPWDRRQTHASLVPYLIEEAYEVVEAIEAEDPSRLKEELGDLLLQIVFHAQMAREAGDFTIDHVCQGIVDKMVRRHPHVFGNAQVSTAQDVVVQWEEIKMREKGATRRSSMMDGIPQQLPALLLAERVQGRASEVGFDWEALSGAIDKFKEEIDELALARDQSDPIRMAEEYGDLLFSLVAVGRHLNLIAEQSLRGATRRFIMRFKSMEAVTRDRSLSLSDLKKDDLADLWQQAKIAVAEEESGNRDETQFKP